MPRDPDSDSSDDDCFGDVGFMFDGALQKARRVFCFGDISVAVRLVDADPGAVQSGHYVWPAAPAMSAFLVHQRQFLPTGAVLELGAGCGLGGLVAAQLPGTTAVVFTDHDPGVLEIIGESIAEQAKASDLGWRAAAAKSRCVQLRWGRIGETQQRALKMALASISPSNDTGGREGDDVIGGGGKEDDMIGGEGKGDDMIGGEGKGDDMIGGEGKEDDMIGGEGKEDDMIGGEGKEDDMIGGEEKEDDMIGGEGKEDDMIGGEGKEDDMIGREGKGDDMIGGERKEDDMIGGESKSVFPVAGPGRRTGDVSFDLVIGSDVIYSSTIVEPLFSTVDSLLSRGFIPKQSKTASDVASKCTTDNRGGYPAGASTYPCLGPDITHALGDDVKGNNTVTTMMSPPLFIMSQSFPYDSDTEEAIDFACSEHGLEREIVWDNLQLAPTTARAHQDGREGFVDIEEGGSITGRGDGKRSEATGGCRILSESTRAGTKLQLFRRSF